MLTFIFFNNMNYKNNNDEKRNLRLYYFIGQHNVLFIREITTYLFNTSKTWVK